jgi:UDP:flavonoid glycosyltransferase YjiC (YdhE family)
MEAMVPTVRLFGDQPRNAARVEAGGAGIVVEPDEVSHGLGSLSPEGALRIRTAVEHVQANGAFRAAAARVAAELRQLPPVDDVLDALLA